MGLYIVIAVIVILFLWFIATYNRLISAKNAADNSWADIDVQLKRRYDLIPNLVETVKGYAGHEKTFSKIDQSASAAMAAKTPADHAAAEDALSGTLKTLFAVAENYPDLKASQNFMELQSELRDTEDKVQASRRFYNANVRDWNTLIQQFPTNFIGQPHEIHRPPILRGRRGGSARSTEGSILDFEFKIKHSPKNSLWLIFVFLCTFEFKINFWSSRFWWFSLAVLRYNGELCPPLEKSFFGILFLGVVAGIGYAIYFFSSSRPPRRFADRERQCQRRHGRRAYPSGAGANLPYVPPLSGRRRFAPGLAGRPRRRRPFRRPWLAIRRPWVGASSDGKTIRYYDKTTGKFMTVDANGNIVALSDQTFPDVQNVTWSADGIEGRHGIPRRLQTLL